MIRYPLSALVGTAAGLMGWLGALTPENVVVVAALAGVAIAALTSNRGSGGGGRFVPLPRPEWKRRLLSLKPTR